MEVSNSDLADNLISAFPAKDNLLHHYLNSSDYALSTDARNSAGAPVFGSATGRCELDAPLPTCFPDLLDGRLILLVFSDADALPLDPTRSSSRSNP